MLVVVGVRPDTDLAADAGARPRRQGRHRGRPAMRTSLPDVFAAGDCVDHPPPAARPDLPAARHHRAQAGPGRRRERRSAATAQFAGSLGTQVVKVFDLAAARTGLRDHEATAAGFDPVTIADRGRRPQGLLPRQPPHHHPRHRRPPHRPAARRSSSSGTTNAEIAKRIDIAATAIYHDMTVDAVCDLDLSYTPPLGSPWDAVQMAAQDWVIAANAQAEDAAAPGTRR